MKLVRVSPLKVSNLTIPEAHVLLVRLHGSHMNVYHKIDRTRMLAVNDLRFNRNEKTETSEN